MRKSCVLGQRRVQGELRHAVSGVLAAAVLFFMVFHTRSQMSSTLSARALAATKGMLCTLAWNGRTGACYHSTRIAKCSDGE